MKNLIKYFSMLLVILTTAATLNAQVLDKGNFLIGGTMGFSGSDSDVEQTISGQAATERAIATQLNVAPSIGYFVADKFAIGIGLDYTLNTIDRQEEGRSVDSDLLFGPFTRYYIPVGTDKAFFFEANFGYGNSIDEVSFDNQTQNIATQVFAISVGPGFTIFSNDAIGIEAAVKYNYANSNASVNINGESFNTITRTNQLDFSVGLQFYFSRIARASATNQ